MNLDELMNMAEAEDGGPTTKEIFDKPVFDVKSMSGITDPLGFFDPAGFTEGASEGRVRFLGRSS